MVHPIGQHAILYLMEEIKLTAPKQTYKMLREAIKVTLNWGRANVNLPFFKIDFAPPCPPLVVRSDRRLSNQTTC